VEKEAETPELTEISTRIPEIPEISDSGTYYPQKHPIVPLTPLPRLLRV
jgi:hypothetical protein